MASSSASNTSLLETSLIVCAAALVSSLVLLSASSSSKKKKRNHENPGGYPYAATFLQSGRTLSGTEATTALENRGFSMDEALAKAREGSIIAKATTPLQVLESLQKGNCRFWTGNSSRPEASAFERRALIKQQFPSTAILGCADSRVPVEIVFDQGLGDMFVVRVAGNCLGTGTEASLEYAVHHLDIKILLVMGHEGCGAIKASQLPMERLDKESENLGIVLKQLKSGLQDKHLVNIVDERARDRELSAMNVANQVKKLVEEPSTMAKINSGDLIIIGAYYEISSGIVDFFMQVSAPDKDMKPATGVQSRYNPKTKEITYA